MKRLLITLLIICVLMTSCSPSASNYVSNINQAKMEDFMRNIDTQKTGYLFEDISGYKSMEVYLEKYVFGEKVRNVLGPLKLKIDPVPLNLQTNGEMKVLFAWSEPIADGNPWLFNIEMQSINGTNGKHCYILPKGQTKLLTADMSKAAIRDDMALGCLFVSSKGMASDPQFDFDKSIDSNLSSIKEYDETYIVRCRFYTYENDFDNDGKNDLFNSDILESNSNGVATKIAYSIDFGNGDQLKIGEFKTSFNSESLFGYDFNGDGVNEIVFCGEHPELSLPEAISEIALYQKSGNSYELLPLPKPKHWNGADDFVAGYSVYKDDMKDNEVTISSPELNFEQTITLDDKGEALSYFKGISNGSSIGGRAWKVEASEYDGAPVLLMYINIGHKYYDKDLVVYLSMQNKEFHPIKAELEEKFVDYK